jgi:hypothetical protein
MKDKPSISREPNQTNNHRNICLVTRSCELLAQQAGRVLACLEETRLMLETACLKLTEIRGGNNSMQISHAGQISDSWPIKSVGRL